MNHYLLWASGNDRPGFVASIVKTLFELDCNLEDSSMMRLGSEFAAFLIFTAQREITEETFFVHKKNFDLKLGLKKISKKQAEFTPIRNQSYIVRVFGQDQTGIVYHITQCLAKHAFNITDLSTHRTTGGKTPGYILLLEGELLKKKNLTALKNDLKKISTKLKTRISIDPLVSHSF